MIKQTITIEIESDDGIDKSCLEGCWLFDNDFRGVITDIQIK